MDHPDPGEDIITISHRAGAEHEQLSRIVESESFFYWQDELVDCANRLGAEMLGLQAELDKSACNNEVSLTRLVHSWTETSFRSWRQLSYDIKTQTRTYKAEIPPRYKCHFLPFAVPLCLYVYNNTSTLAGSQIKQPELQHCGEGDRVHLRQVDLGCQALSSLSHSIDLTFTVS